jgi:c-di-GMP-related signal transduction protein
MLRSTDLVLSALVRARFCELLSPKAPKAESDLFLVGLVSEVLEKVPLDQQTTTAC